MVWNNPTAGDLCIAHSREEARREHPSLTLAACILASSLAFVDGSVVNVGLPAIGHALHGTASDLQWVVNIYLLPLSALLLLGGALGDRFGRREMLVAGIGAFAAASAVCAAAPDINVLMIARAVQGAGAALLLPNSLAILGTTFSGAARGRAIGIWSSASATTAAIGPVLGGWLIDHFGWRAVFLINLPLAAAAIGLALASIAGARRHDDNARSIDLAGSVLVTASLAALSWSLTSGAGAEGWSSRVVAIAIVGAVFAGTFVWVEYRRGQDAMMPLTLFESADFVGLTGLTFLIYGALGALLVLVPFVLIRGAGYTGTEAGAALLPFPLVLATLSPAMGALAGKFGSRLLLMLGPPVIAAGFFLLARLHPAPDFWTDVFPGEVIIAGGMTCVAAPLTNAVLSSVDAAHTALASGLNSAVARTGGMVATALVGGVFAAQGAGLFHAFHIAALGCAIASLAAGACTFALSARRA